VRIGIIGSGMIGAALGRLWAEAGHQVIFSSRRPESLAHLVRSVGPSATSGTPAEAAQRGEVIVLAVPFSATPGLGAALAPHVAGKPLLDAGNPFPQRDGVVAVEARAGGQGSGVYTARQFPGARVVKAFNTVYYKTLAEEAHREGERVGIPLAGDDAEAVAIAASLVRDAGFDPVVVGPLARSADFDPETAVWNTGMTAAQIRERLGAAQGPA